MGRESTFANDEAIALINEHFVPVAADDWYQRRRDDAVGKFFVGVANQGPRKGEGGGTRQGVYCFTAAGKLLAYRNHSDAGVMLDEFRRALDKFNKLPAAEREPGAVKVPPLDDAKLDQRYARKLPDRAIAIRVFARVLERDADGKCTTCTAAAGKPNYGLLSSLDHLWIMPDEWRALAPRGAKVGDTFAMPAAVAQRIARFHLLDNTRGEPAMWRNEEVRKNAMTLTVVEATAAALKLRLDGEVLLSTDADGEKAKRGYDARLLGHIEIDRAKPAVKRFDIVALGNHWGDSTYTRGARPGRTPFGIAFELADGKQAADAVPPQAAREWNGYVRATR
ncbi:MAG: hypothetical protein WD875_01445 [Pirellulales bacterium]